MEADTSGAAPTSIAGSFAGLAGTKGIAESIAAAGLSKGTLASVALS